jgi:hypothetical protein
MIFDSIQPVKPFVPKTEEEKRNLELYDAIRTAIHACGYSGGDVTMMSLEVLRRIGRDDLLPPCERRKIETFNR